MSSRQIKLTKHENRKFEAQTVHLSGQAFFNCTFVNCTLIVTNVSVVLNGCHFDKCNWNLQYEVLWGDPETHKFLRSLIDLLEGKSSVVASQNVH